MLGRLDKKFSGGWETLRVEPCVELELNLRERVLEPSLLIKNVIDRRGCEGEFMDGFSRMDLTQSEGDLPDFNQSEN